MYGNISNNNNDTYIYFSFDELEKLLDINEKNWTYSDVKENRCK